MGTAHPPVFDPIRAPELVEAHNLSNHSLER